MTPGARIRSQWDSTVYLGEDPRVSFYRWTRQTVCSEGLAKRLLRSVGAVMGLDGG